MRKTRSGKSRDYRDVIVFEKLRFQNVFRPHEGENSACSNSSGLKGVFETLCYRDGLVWTVGLTVEIKLIFFLNLTDVEWTLLNQSRIAALIGRSFSYLAWSPAKGSGVKLVLDRG